MFKVPDNETRLMFEVPDNKTRLMFKVPDNETHVSCLNQSHYEGRHCVARGGFFFFLITAGEGRWKEGQGGLFLLRVR